MLVSEEIQIYLLAKVKLESNKEGLTINYKEIDNVLDSKRGNRRCEVVNGEVRIK